jgi:hypothetical protein
VGTPATSCATSEQPGSDSGAAAPKRLRGIAQYTLEGSVVFDGSQIIEAEVEHETAHRWSASCMALAGRFDEARNTFGLIRDLDLQPAYRAMVRTVLGEESAALDEPERGRAERSVWISSIGTQPWCRVLHTHPRFLRLRQDMRLELAEHVLSR